MKIFARTLFVMAIALASMNASAQYGTGLAIDIAGYQKVDKADLKSLGFSGTLPAKVLLTDYTPHAGNQGFYGTCVGWGSAYGALTTSLAKQMDIKNKNVLTATAFCPYFVYNQIKDPSNTDCSMGTQLYKALNLFYDNGSKRYYLPEYDCGINVDNRTLTNAFGYRIKGAKGLFEYPETVQTLEDVFAAQVDKTTPTKQSLANGIAVPIAMLIPNSFDLVTTDLFTPTAAEQANPMTAITGQDGGVRGHAMAIVGYDDNKYGGSFLILNSWGEGWGNKGYTWMKYSDYNKWVLEAYTFDLFERDYSKPGCQLGDCNTKYSRFKMDDGSVYEGELKEGVITGLGYYVWPSGEVHTGEWKDNQRNGIGASFFANGTVRKGVWAADNYRGPISQTASTKTGCASGNCTTGLGTMIYSNGDTYVGYFKDGKRSGKGTYTIANGDSYEGTWLNDVQHGLVKYQVPSGAFYLGEFKNGDLVGYGIQVSADGRMTGGTIVNGQFKPKDGGLGFAGGTPLTNISLADQPFEVEAAANNSNCLTGDCFNGWGKFKFNTGEVYEGEFKQGAIHGFGTLDAGNGVRYVGEWQFGKMEGVGKLEMPDATFIGFWKGAKKEGYGLEYRNSGSYTAGIWDNNTYTSKSSFGFAAVSDQPLAEKEYVKQVPVGSKVKMTPSPVAKASKPKK